MLCCETGGATAQDVEELAVFVSQLDALGMPARVDVRSVPDGLNRNAQFDLAAYLSDCPLGTGDRVALLGANRLTDQRLSHLRRLAGPGVRECLAFGAFPSRQALIGAKAKLSYVFGQDPQVFDLGAGPRNHGEVNRGCPVFGVPRRAAPAAAPRLLVVAPRLQDHAEASALIALGLSAQFDTAVLTDGRTKHQWIAGHGARIALYHFGEILPSGLAERIDICVSFAPLQHNYRLQCLIANLAISGGALVDATPGHVIAQGGDAFIRGPVDLRGLASFVASEIVPNLGQIGTQVRESQFAARSCAGPVLDFLRAEARPRPAPRPVEAPARVVFMPTNGVGLGHAQRCALVAAELDRARADPVFATFPSCAPLVKSRGFDVMPLIGRSALHAQTHENDLANYLRLRSLTTGARTLVFDGGYVFDSVYRSILENRLRGVWLRRGLWQEAQDNAIALDREKAFTRVIVPSEAFDELNAAYSHGDHLRVVGPIVQRAHLGHDARRALREALTARFEREFDRLVVSLLGAGVAADREAQTQALCGMMERRPDVLHLIVAWPTATLQPVWFGWSNSRVVRTQRAGVLAAASDLCISAAGYNSFHEALYNAIPAIFIPQMGAFMDDQRARARAARERALAGCVEPNQLMTLEREIARFLDEGKVEDLRARLAALVLPEPGAAQAARLIEDVSDG